MTKKIKQKPNWLDPNTTSENEVLPRYFKWAWMSRGLSLAISAVVIMRLTYYLTDIIGMSPLLVGSILLASKIFDGLTDLVTGVIIDRTNTKLGKARPYEFMIVLLWVSVVFMFSMPDLSRNGQIIYVFVMYALTNSVFNTMLDAADAVYLARSVRSEKNRISVMSFNGAIIMICSIVMSIMMPQFLSGIASTRVGWTKLTLSFAIPLAIIGLFRFIFIKEVVTDVPVKSEEKKAQHIPLKQSLKGLFRNPYAFIFAGMMFVVQLINNMSAATDYYSKYVLGDIGMGTMLSMGMAVTPLVLVFFPLLAKKFGTTNIARGGAAISILGYLLRILGGTNMTTLILGSVLSGIGVIPITMMGSVYIIDCMEYGEWKNGFRNDGVVASVKSFCSKLGTGLASGLLGVIMGNAGFDGNLAVQSASAITAIKVVFNWVPLVGMVILFALTMVYTLEKKMPQIKAELDERHRVSVSASAEQ